MLACLHTQLAECPWSPAHKRVQPAVGCFCLSWSAVQYPQKLLVNIFTCICSTVKFQATVKLQAMPRMHLDCQTLCQSSLGFSEGRLVTTGALLICYLITLFPSNNPAFNGSPRPLLSQQTHPLLGCLCSSPAPSISTPYL